ncbi:GntR family transcriptional regulator [Nocardioides lianchengensis]|uniref:GntR family transcriptional regulator n=2 Tax=Nocardioides lianchengensis TaxID=1045774 RepID=A0A1G7C8T7_9ACTN|nr:GntR family transcriptional regulator [Nocardioides lianchengensis]
MHARIAEELRGRIARGELARGTALPSEAQLCQQFGASRGTIRSALATLRQQGLIGGGQGRSPMVLDSALGQPFETLISFSTWAQDAGRVPGQRTIEVARRQASVVAATALQLDEDTPVVDVLRLRLLDGEPAMLERSTFVTEVGRLLFDFDPDSGSIWAYLTAQGADLHSARHTFDAVAADEVDAELLQVEVGSPLLRERRLSTTSSGVPLEYSDDRYRPDRVTFTIANSHASAAGVRPDLRILKESS